MHKNIRKYAIIFFLTLPCAYANTSSPKSELNNLNKNIASIQTDLHKAVIKKTHLQTALEQIETTESKINHQLKKTQHHLSLSQRKLKHLQQHAIPLTISEKENRELLKKQIVAAYLLSHEPYLKLLLTPNDITKTHLLMNYYHYITNAQIHTITKLQKTIQITQKNQKIIQHQYARLETLKHVQLQNQYFLQKTRAERQNLIQAIDQHIKSKHEKLLLLIKDKQRLETMLEKLNLESETNFNHEPFALLKGKLPLPLHGTLLHSFGTQIDQSELRWDGILINAPIGSAVHAVAAGKVIFSKWMAGYGLLLIINHGNGYMTLYGRNQTVDKKVGDFVKAGDVIAEAGKSGGFLHSALYFSIRHNANALNPLVWCR